MNKHLRKIYRHLFPHWVKNALHDSIVELERFHPPSTMSRLPGERVLVLAPHPDDESIGCGGAICKYIEQDSRLLVVFVTDGRQGDRDLRALPADSQQRLQMESELAARRRREAHCALSVLGVSEFEFLDAADGELRHQINPVSERLAAILSKFKPDVVMLPFLTDRHADHFAVNSCLFNAIERLQGEWLEKLQCFGYEIWSPIYANALVDITAYMRSKRDALKCYQSQLESNDYIAGIEGLNQFRAVSGMTGGRCAEAFFAVPYKTYHRLYQQLLL